MKNRVKKKTVIITILFLLVAAVVLVFTSKTAPMFMVEDLTFGVLAKPDITANDQPNDSPYGKYKDKLVGVIEKENRIQKPKSNLESVKIDVGTKIYTIDFEGAANDPEYGDMFNGPKLLIETQGGAVYPAYLYIKNEEEREAIVQKVDDIFYPEPEEEVSDSPESSLEEPIEEEEPVILPEHWYKFSPTPEDIITFRFVDFKDDPVPGLYIDLYPRVIVEPGEKRVQTGPVPVLTGQTDQNGEIVWHDYFPCREGEEYVLQVTSAAIGERNYTNTTSYVLSDLKGLDGGYIAKYLWEEGYHSTDEAKLLDADFISDNELLLHYSFNPGGNIFEIYNIDTLKTTAVPLTEYMNDAGVHGMTNGKDVVYAYTETSYAVIDKATKSIIQFGDFPESHGFTDCAISVDGNYIYRNEKEIGISPINDLTQKEVLKVSDEKYFFHAPHYSPDGKKVLLWEGEAPGHGVHCVDLSTGDEAIIPFFSDWDPAQEWFFSDLLWSYNSDEVYFSMHSFPDEEKTILVRFDAATGEKISQYDPPCPEGKICHIRLLDAYQDKLLFTTNYYYHGPEDPHTLYLFDLNSDEFIPLAAVGDNNYFQEAHFSPDGSKVVALNPSNIPKQMQIISLNNQ